MYIEPNGIRITQIFWAKGMELLFTEAKSQMEVAPPTELEVLANTTIAE